MTRIRKLQLAI